MSHCVIMVLKTWGVWFSKKFGPFVLGTLCFLWLLTAFNSRSRQEQAFHNSQTHPPESRVESTVYRISNCRVHYFGLIQANHFPETLRWLICQFSWFSIRAVQHSSICGEKSLAQNCSAKTWYPFCRSSSGMMWTVCKFEEDWNNELLIWV